MMSDDVPIVTSQQSAGTKAVLVTSQENVEVVQTREDEDCSVALVQTDQQKHKFRTQALFSTSSGGGRPSKKSSSSSAVEVVNFRGKPATPDSKHTYKRLNDATLRNFYGRETPYGTVQRFNFAQDEFENDEEITAATAAVVLTPKSPRRRVTSVSSYHSLSSPGSSPKQQRDAVFATLIRARVGGVRQVDLAGADDSEGNSLYYADFLPAQTRKERFSIGGYEPFTCCVDKANEWLKENLNVKVKKCESLRHRLDHDHRINPESTTTDDRSYVIGLRVWYSRKQTANTKPMKLLHYNIIPDYKNEGKWKAKDCPKFVTLQQSIDKWNNDDFKIEGDLINVESVPLNYSVVHRSPSKDHQGQLDADTSYCCLDFQGRWAVVVTRMYFVQDPQVDYEGRERVQLEFKDFTPAPISLPPARCEFQSYEKLLISLNRWLKQQKVKNIVGVQSVEVPFRPNNIAYTKGKVDSSVSGHDDVRSPVHWHTVRVIRIWSSTSPLTTTSTVPSNDMMVAMRCFTPHQITTSGCCGVRKPIYESLTTLWDRARNWVELSGVKVLSIETDTVEKWLKSDQEHDKLVQRTYNKEDHKKTWTTSSLDYRLTTIRIFYDHNSMQVLDGYTLAPSPPPPKPAEPCCCLVGCTVM